MERLSRIRKEFAGLLPGQSCLARLRVRDERIAAADVPRDQAGITAPLTDRWLSMDRFVDR